MILLCGIPSEPPVAFIQEQLNKMGSPYVIFNQRLFAEMALGFEVSNGIISGQLQIHGEIHNLDEFNSVYIRLMDDQMIPELFGEPYNSPKRAYCHALHDALIRWCEIAPIRVVNRMGPMGSNFSKPYQLQLIKKHDFDVPDTLITNDPKLVHDFKNKHKNVVYKSISGVRSIVRTLQEEDLSRLNRIRWCPTQFQEYIEGNDIRVHTIGGEVFAAEIISNATDYRYANSQVGDPAELKPIRLPLELEEKCIKLSEALGLAFAGIDLKITPDNRIYCFEVNPSPGYSYYESNTGQPISRAVARFLVGLT